MSLQDQQIMKDICKEYGIDRAASWDKVNDTEIENLKNLPGKETIALSPTEQAKMRAVAQTVINDWAKSVTAKNVPGMDLVNFVKERIDYWSKQK
jgi:TRAP-type C4-dicarboxylate transport system substrate-binding protein